MNSFDYYLVKTSNLGVDHLISSAKSGSDVVKVQQAAEKSGNKISKSQAAMLIALGIGVGVTGTLVYKQRKENKRALRS